MAQQRSSNTPLYVFLGGAVVITGATVGAYYLWGRPKPTLPPGAQLPPLPGGTPPRPQSAKAPTASAVANAMNQAKPNAAAPPRTLRAGMKGNDVYGLQTVLQQLGYTNVNADGDFGPVTLKAVIEFQQKNLPAADGVVGPQTWQKLQAALKAKLVAQGAVIPGADSTLTTSPSSSLSASDLQAAYAAAVKKLNGSSSPLTEADRMAASGAFAAGTDQAKG